MMLGLVHDNRKSVTVILTLTISQKSELQHCDKHC